MDIKFCTACGNPVHMIIPPDDDHLRAVCGTCGQIHYSNPKVVVGTIPEFEGRILMCKRDIEPRRGFWTLPAGFLEDGESVQDGAARETREETQAEVTGVEAYRLFNITFVSQIYMMFRAQMVSDHFGPTTESSQVRLFSREEIPWDRIAFRVIEQTLDHYFKDRETGRFPFGVFDIR